MQVAPFQRSRTLRTDRGVARRHVVHHDKLHFVNGHLTDPYLDRARYTLAGARACRETSEFVAFDPAVVPPRSKMGGGASSRSARLPGPASYQRRVRTN